MTKKKVKSGNDKSKKNEISVKSDEKAKSGYGFSIIKVLLVLTSIGSTVFLYHMYTDLSSIPNTPDIDLNKWWGLNDTSAQDTSIRPYRIIFSEAMQEEIRALFEEHRRANRKIKSFEDTAWAYGVHSDAFAQFFAYWLFTYSFRHRERFLNQFEHFKTNIQGLDIHFMRVKPKVEKDVKVVPLLLLHGWPGSVREFYEAIPHLTTSKPGYDFVFEVIAPSLPGFAYSQATTKPGLTPLHIAVIMRNLMHRLGFKQYFVQGGDYGHAIGSNMATLFPEEVLGFHTSMPVNFSKLAVLTLIVGEVWPTLVGGEFSDKMYPLNQKLKFYLEETGYMHLQGTKPDTIGIALLDSPVALANYILDRFMIFTNYENKLKPDGGLETYYSYDKLIDNIMLYWSTNSIITSLRLYKECLSNADEEQIMGRIPTKVPTWALRTKYELVHQPDFILKWKYSNLVGASNWDFGGHFAAFEKPEKFADDVFKGVREMLKLNE
ncbi:hypothetical protein K1T71_012501 [Dendrolimus kikuchii]|uniref:Uncharacterized protein n=1 Tax=Dendrolimus kikuchii TaxID=765133 RepID=A0ACC1CJH6_9NEOP|nr:hypothetical protein K1T71_012501 [Dendrolimus kikuchii]